MTNILTLLVIVDLFLGPTSCHSSPSSSSSSSVLSTFLCSSVGMVIGLVIALAAATSSSCSLFNIHPKNSSASSCLPCSVICEFCVVIVVRYVSFCVVLVV